MTSTNSQPRRLHSAMIAARWQVERQSASVARSCCLFQLKAGHSQGSITERYIHAAQVLFLGAAEKGEARMFGKEVANPVAS
jgi:hypothetical protein